MGRDREPVTLESYMAFKPALRVRIAAIVLHVVPVLALAAPEPGAPQFRPGALRAHVAFLADDLLEGRQSGSRGYDIAARYVAAGFASLGLKPPVEGGWFQRVPFVGARLSAAKPPTLSIDARTFEHKVNVLMSPYVLESTQLVEAGVVFAGYCIDKPDQGLDDYAGLDVKGKLVACLSGFPKGMKSDIGAHLASRRLVMAQERGAIGVLSLGTIQSDKAFPWRVMVEQSGDPASAWVQADGKAYREAPRMRVGARLDTIAAEALFAGAPRSVAEILAEADRTGGKPRGFPLRPRVKLSRESELYRYESPNVVGLLPGSDPSLAKEVVVLMAHLDHLGPLPTGEGDRIRNGALDNAAGVATMLEVARAITSAPTRPRRSVLFAAVTGEEQGLLGSQFLARQPVVPDATVVALVNLDSPILLYDFTDVIAFGAEHSTLGPIVARATERAGIRSSPDPLPEQSLFTRSDHYNFVKEGVPAVFLVTGFDNGGEKHFREFLAKHYHRPSDQMDLPIHWDAAARFARVNYLIVREIADEARRPLWYEDSLFGTAFAPRQAKAKRRSARYEALGTS